MKSKASYFSLSGSLIRENLRRFWALPALAFLVYFLSSVFPMLIFHGRLEDMADYIQMCLTNMQPFFMAAHLCVPIFAAIIIFRYLQSVPGATTMHSLPFSRAILFNSGLVSGLIMITIPILLNGLLLLLVKQPVSVSWMGNPPGSDIFTGGAIWNWIGSSVLIVIFIYIIAVFAGIVTGTSLLHLIGAVGFNFLAAALYGAFVLYFMMFLYGYNPSGDWGRTMALLSPFSGIFLTPGHFTAGQVTGYLITFFAVLILSAFLYQKRKLERAGDAMAFWFMEPVISYLIAFFGMTGMGFYFSSLGEGQTDTASFFTYLGFAFGTVIFFLIGRMVVKKTARIFDLGSLKSFAAYALIAALFLIGLNIDITGFERRVPDLGSVDQVVVQGHNIAPALDYMAPSIAYKDPASIASIAAFHKSIVKNKDRFLNNETIYKLYLTLTYQKGKGTLSRSYHVDYNFFLNSPQMKTFYESKEYKDLLGPSGLEADSFSSITLYSPKSKRDITIGTDGNFQELLDAYEADLRVMSFEDMMSAKRPYCTMAVSYYQKRNSRGEETYNTVEYRITPACTRSIQWLKENGYWNDLPLTAEDIDNIAIYKASFNADDIALELTPQEKDEGQLVMEIRDKEQIRLLLENADRFVIDESSYYYGRVQLTAPAYDAAASESGSHIKYDDDVAVDYSESYEIFYFNNGIGFLK